VSEAVIVDIVRTATGKRYGGLSGWHPVDLLASTFNLGRPLGASGSRIMATMLSELERTEGRYGLQAMCKGGGIANATIIERLA
jgi:acetyl-CoA acetyltransferase